MKKRALIVVAAMILGMSSALTAFAQPSINVDAVIDVNKVVDKDGKEVASVVVSEPGGEDLDKAKEIIKPENLEQVLPKAEAKEDWSAFVTEAVVVDDQGQEVDWEEIKGQFPVEITFNVPGVTENSRIRILHYYEGEWHTHTVTGNAKDAVTVKFEHLTGPIVILVNNSVPSDEAPKTGQGNFALYAVAIAAVAFAGAVAVKKKENK